MPAFVRQRLCLAIFLPMIAQLAHDAFVCTLVPCVNRSFGGFEGGYRDEVAQRVEAPIVWWWK
jgi:hypothetical protein